MSSTTDSPLRVLAHSKTLAPVGGVEVCTLQDTLALSRRQHKIDVMYETDGPYRALYTAAGVGLKGPYQFSFDPRHGPADLVGYLPEARWARSRRADVLWLNRIEHLIWGQAVSRWAGIPLVCHLHGPPVYQRLHLVGRGVAHFIAVSDFIRDQYIAVGIEPERISRVYNAIPGDQYPFGGPTQRHLARQQLGLPADVPIVLCYGQMSAEKGIPELLEAWGAVVANRPEALLVLVDAISDHPEPVVQRVLATLNPNSYRVFPIASDVVPFLHACDVVAFPTRLPEAFGRVVVEGMTTGRPVVASRVGAIPEILSGAMSRFLVEPGSSEELANALESALDWRENEPRLGAECAAWVDRLFQFERHVADLEAILLDHRRSR